MALVDVSRDNPFRPASWRWQRAVAALAGTQPRPGRKFDGAQGYYWIKRAMNFKAALDAAAGNETAIRRLATDMPDIYWAHTAWANEDRYMRYDIEAQILARVDNYSAGFACGCAPEIIEAFENLFFNVREKLHHTRYIIHCVFGPAVHQLSERQPELLWKLYAFFYGPEVLAALVQKVINPAWCTTPDSCNSSLQDDAIASLKFKAALAAKTVPVNSHTQIELLHVFTKFIEVERTTDSAGKAQNQILDHISAMMTTLPFNVGGRDPRQGILLPARPSTHYRKTSVELSLHEGLVVSTGQDLPYREELEELGFPELPALAVAGGGNEKAE